MEIKIFLPIFLLMSCGSNLYSSADSFKCAFGTYSDPSEEYPEIANAYNCNVTEIRSTGALGIVSGDHVGGKTDNDVTYAFYDPEDTGTISKLDAIFCNRFKNLQAIIFRDVIIHSIDGNALSGCSKLGLAQFVRNEISQISENLFSKNSKLEYVILKENKIATLPEKVFFNLKELKELDLQYNEIKTLPANIFKSLGKLQLLKLFNNEIGALNPVWFQNLNNLKELYLEFNQIKDLPQNVFTPLKKLRVLNLGGNQLTIIHADSFPRPNKLEFIKFWSNQINAVDEKLIDVAEIAVIDLDGNPCAGTFLSIEVTKLNKDFPKSKIRECINNYQPRS